MNQLSFNFPILPNSLITQNEVKANIIEWWWWYYDRHKITFETTAKMIEHRFKMTESEYFSKPLTKEEILFYYKIKGSYRNNVRI